MPVPKPKKQIAPDVNPFGASTPASAYTYDLSDLRTFHGSLVAGLSDVQAVRQASRFLLPQQVALYADWARQHPTVDPRTWAPLAQGGVHPNSDTANQVARADIARQIAEGTYGQTVGQVSTPPQTPKNDNGGGGVFGFLNRVAGNTVHDASIAGDYGYNAVKGTTRVALTGLAAPKQAMDALFRTTGGNQAEEQAIIKQYGLSKEEADAAFAGAGTGKTLGGTGGPEQPSDPTEANRVAAMAMLNGQGKPVWAFDADAQARIRAAQNAWNTSARQEEHQNILGSVVKQTEAGQLFENPSLLTQTTNKAGQVTQQRAWLPSKEAQAASEKKALEAWDIRTADEKARNVRPTAMTMGRLIAHRWYSPDEAAFNAVSGAVDMTSSLTMDPVNLIPAGAAGKVVRAPLVLSRRGARALGVDVAPDIGSAFRTGVGAEPVVVRSPTAQFAKGGVPGGVGYQGARAGARSKAAVAAAREQGATKVLDPMVKTDLETGRILTPHGQFVMTKNAWDWLNRGRGARVVDQLSRLTSPTEIWLRSGRQMDMDLAMNLADAKTPAEVRAILGTRMGYEVGAGDLGSLGRSGPALFKNRALLDSGGLFQVPGTKKYQAAREAGQGRAGALRTQAWQANVATAKAGGANFIGARLDAASGIGVGWFRQAPATRTLDLEDADVTAHQLEAFMRGTRIPGDQAIKHIDAVLRESTGAGRYRAIYGDGGLLEAGVKDALVKQGLDVKHATAMTRAFEGGIGDFNRQWFNDSLADGYTSAPGNVGRVLLENEQLSKTAALPDYRTLRRTTSSIDRITRSLGTPEEITGRVADFLHGTTSVWRMAVLLRPAYVLRELGELAFATSLGGYKSLLTHPGAFIAAAHQTALSKEIAETTSRTAGALSGAWIRRGMFHLSEGVSHLNPMFEAHGARINGDAMWEQANRVIRDGSSEHVASMFDGLSSISGNFQLDDRGARNMAKGAKVLSRDDPAARDEYIHALVEKIQKASGDRDMRNLANPEMTHADVMQAFLAGSHDLKRVMRPDLLTGTRKSSERYIEGYRDLLQQVTMGDEGLLEAVRTGKYADRALIYKAGGRNRITVGPELKARIEALLDDPEKRLTMPDVLHGFGTEYAKQRWGRQFTNDFFASTGEWSDLFFRGPLIRQAYTQRVLQLAPDLSPAAKWDAVAKLRKAGDLDLARQVARTQTNKAGTLGIDEVDAIASGFARKESQRLYYDAHRRQNYALALRTVMPFAQATFNTFRRWGELSMRNPQFMYRSTKPIEALTDPGSAAIYQIMSAMIPGNDGLDSFYSPHDDALNADGFFYTDSYGDRKYAFPALGGLAGLMPGTQPGAVSAGSASGLNVAGTSLFPGAGPMVTLGESLVVPESIYHNDWQGAVLKATNQYGLPKGSLAEKVWGTVAANWMRRLQSTSDPEQAAARTIKASIALKATGEYDATSASDQRRLVNDARALSESMNLLDTLGVAVAPGSFTTQFLVEIKGDKTGDVRRMVLADKLAQEYQKYTKALPGQDPLVAKDQGEAQFLKDYGQTALLSVLPRTQVDGPQATNDVWMFRSQNPSAYNNNQPIIGMFFAGGDPQGTFSQDLYRWQQATGERKAKNPDQFITDANKELGWLAWNAKQAQIDALPADQQPVVRAQVRANIEDKFPGWTGKAADLGAFDTKMKQIRDALKDPAISSLQSADYIETYIKTRDDALRDLETRFGVTTLDSKTAKEAGITDQLLGLGQYLRQQDTSGGFTNAWSRLFSQEFPDSGGSGG